MADEQTVNVKGTGGAELTLTLPLPEAYAEQVKKGHLVPTDEESEELLAQYADGLPEEEAEDEVDPDALPPRSGKGSGKQAWLDYAAAHGIDVDPEMEYSDLQDAIEDAAGG